LTLYFIAETIGLISEETVGKFLLTEYAYNLYIGVLLLLLWNIMSDGRHLRISYAVCQAQGSRLAWQRGNQISDVPLDQIIIWSSTYEFQNYQYTTRRMFFKSKITIHIATPNLLNSKYILRIYDTETILSWNFHRISGNFQVVRIIFLNFGNFSFFKKIFIPKFDIKTWSSSCIFKAVNSNKVSGNYFVSSGYNFETVNFYLF
jgi:hypothetical protein